MCSQVMGDLRVHRGTEVCICMATQDQPINVEHRPPAARKALFSARIRPTRTGLLHVQYTDHTFDRQVVMLLYLTCAPSKHHRHRQGIKLTSDVCNVCSFRTPKLRQNNAMLGWQIDSLQQKFNTARVGPERRDDERSGTVRVPASNTYHRQHHHCERIHPWIINDVSKSG